jgi:hypothetical protein
MSITFLRQPASGRSALHDGRVAELAEHAPRAPARPSLCYEIRRRLPILFCPRRRREWVGAPDYAAAESLRERLAALMETIIGLSLMQR